MKVSEKHHIFTYLDYIFLLTSGRWTKGRSGERGSGISVLPARYDDDDIYIYIYIYQERERERIEREISNWDRWIDIKRIYIYIYIYIYIERERERQTNRQTETETVTEINELRQIDTEINVKLPSEVEGDPNVPFALATTPACWGGRKSFPGIALLYPWSVPYND